MIKKDEKGKQFKVFIEDNSKSTFLTKVKRSFDQFRELGA